MSQAIINITPSTSSGVNWMTGDNGNKTGDILSQECLLFRFVLYTVIMGVTCQVGIVGNTLSFAVLRHDRRVPAAAFLLQTLAIADSSYLILWMINYTFRDLIRFFELHAIEHHPAWLLARVYTYPALFMAQFIVIWLTVVIALNRYLVACRPDWLISLHRFPRLNVRLLVLVVIVTAVVYNTPRYCEMYVTFGSNGTSYWNKTSLALSSFYKLVYIDIMYYVVSFVLPLITLVYVSFRVIVAYRVARAYRRKSTMSVLSMSESSEISQTTVRSAGDRNETGSSITLVMIVVVLVFMTCQAPARLVQFAWSYSFMHCRHYQFYLIHVSNTLEVLNSSTNFVVYCLFYKRFRRKLQRQFCRRSACVNKTTSVTINAININAFSADTTERLALVTMGDLLQQEQAI